MVFSDSFVFLKIVPFGFLWIVSDYSGYFWMLSDFFTFFWTFSSYNQIVLEPYRYFQILADSSKLFQIFLDSSRSSHVLTDSFRISRFLPDSFKFLQILSKPPSGILKILSNFSVLYRSFQTLSDPCRFFQILLDSSAFLDSSWFFEILRNSLRFLARISKNLTSKKI